jgi:hypothetical protein
MHFLRVRFRAQRAPAAFALRRGQALPPLSPFSASGIHPPLRTGQVSLDEAEHLAAEDLIRRWLDQAIASGRAGLQQVAAGLQPASGQLRTCAPFGRPKPLPPLDHILGSHPLLLAAEGQLSRHGLASAAESEGLPELHVAPVSAVGEAIAAAVSRIGRAAGPP